MVTQSMIPYQGPGCLTALPAEILQSVASNLDANSIRSLRLASRSARAKTTFNFVHTCLHSLAISTTKVGIKRGLHALQIEYVNTATKLATFTQSLSENGLVYKFGSGSRSRPYYTHANTPSKGDIKVVVNHMPNVNAIVMRDATTESTVTQSLCQALTAAPRMQLTDLTIDGIKLSGKTLIGLLNAHRKTLRYLVLRDVHSTDGKFVKKMLETLSCPCFGLTRLVIDNISEGQGSMTPFALTDGSVDEPDIALSAPCPECNEFQHCVLWSDDATMGGHRGVDMGIVEILSNIS